MLRSPSLPQKWCARMGWLLLASLMLASCLSHRRPGRVQPPPARGAAEPVRSAGLLSELATRSPLQMLQLCGCAARLPSLCHPAQTLLEALLRDAPCTLDRRAFLYIDALLRRLSGTELVQLTGLFQERFQCQQQPLARDLGALWDQPHLGNQRGDVPLLEFADLRCPTCQAGQPHLRQLLDRATLQRVAYVVLLRPGPDPQEQALAAAALAAHLQGEFWRFREAAEGAGEVRGDAGLRALAQRVGLSLQRFEEDRRGRAAQLLERHRRLGDDLGVRETPTFFVNGCRFVPRPGLRGAEELADWVKDVWSHYESAPSSER